MCFNENCQKIALTVLGLVDGFYCPDPQILETCPTACWNVFDRRQYLRGRRQNLIGRRQDLSGRRQDFERQEAEGWDRGI